MRERLDAIVEELLEKGIRYDEVRREIERRFIARALARADGNLSRTAELLGWHRNTLSRRMTELRLTRRSR